MHSSPTLATAVGGEPVAAAAPGYHHPSPLPSPSTGSRPPSPSSTASAHPSHPRPSEAPHPPPAPPQMDRYEQRDDEVVFWDANTQRTTPGSMDFFSEGEILASNPGLAGFTAAATSSGGLGVPPPRGSGGMEELDLNSQAPDLDVLMTFGQLLRSSSAGTIGEAEAAVLRRGVASSRGGGASCGAATTRTRSVGAPAGTATRLYHAPLPAGAATRAPGGGRRGVHGGAGVEAGGPDEEDDGDHDALGQELMANGTMVADEGFWKKHTRGHAEWRKLKNGPPECLEDLQVMFEHTVMDGSSSCVLGEHIVDEDEAGDGDDGSPMSINSLKKGGSCSTSATIPRKRVKSHMVKIMKGIWETIQANSVVAQKVMQGELRSESIKQVMCLAVESGAVEGSAEHFMASQLFVKAEIVMCSLPFPPMREG